MSMDLAHLLQQLATSLGVDSLELNEHGVLSLQFDDKVIVHMEPDPQTEDCHMYSSLCRIPDDEGARLALFSAILAANGFGRGTLGAAFAVDEQAQEVILARIFRPERTEVEDLRHWISEMVSAMNIWLQRLPELGGEGQGQAASSAEHPPGELVHMLRI